MKKSSTFSRILATACLGLASLASTAQAAEGDLVLPGAKWWAGFESYVCSPEQTGVSTPAFLADLNVKFDRIVTDSTLDNVLLTANFAEGESDCRYSAILFADNAAKTIRLVESKAFAATGDATCQAGKEVLDSKVSATNYLYYGHPHRAAIMMATPDAEALCGAGATAVGPAFVVKGKIQQ